jgi:hypothetical protein
LVNTEVILEFDSCHVAKVTLEYASLSSVSGREGSSGELAKDIYVRGLRVMFNDLEVVSLISFVLELRYYSGQLEVSVRFDDTLRTALSDQFADMVATLRRDSDTWECSSVFGRPSEQVSNAAKEWWRYGVRVLMRNNGGLKDLDSFLDHLRMCREYHNLHVARLRKGGQVAAAERERCEQIESHLSVETVLLLRGKARKAVRADQAAKYAAEDWLGWMVGVATSRPSSDREETASEIRQAITALEDARSEGSDEKFDGALSALGLPTGSALTLNSVRLSIEVANFSLHTLSSEDALDIETSLRTINVALDIDGAFTTLNLEFSIGDVIMRDWQSQYVQHYATPLSVDCRGSTSDRVENATQNERGDFMPGFDGESSSKLFMMSAKIWVH